MQSKNIIAGVVVIGIAFGAYFFYTHQEASPVKEKVSEATQEATKEATSTKEFKGNWFSIFYPANFIVQSSSMLDEATFSSPDGAVEFFVYSPQWYGNPTQYLKQQVNEKKISDESSKETAQSDSAKVTRWVTYVANDNSYTRSFVSIKDGVFDTPDQYGQDAQTHHVFGIKFKNKAAYDMYLPQYLDFKKSLIQYAD